MRTGFENRPGVEYEADKLDRFFAEDLQAIADIINGLPDVLADLVPYTGATSNLDLGVYKLLALESELTGTVTATAGFARGLYLHNTLKASANGDILALLYAVPSFNNNGKTGLKKYGFYIGGNNYFESLVDDNCKVSLSLSSRLVYDSAENAGIDYENFVLFNKDQLVVYDWAQGLLYGNTSDLSIDLVNRILYANDGSTANINYATPGVVAFGLPSDTVTGQVLINLHNLTDIYAGLTSSGVLDKVVEIGNVQIGYKGIVINNSLASARFIFQGMRVRGTPSEPTPTINGDHLFSLSAQTIDTSTGLPVSVGAISFIQDGNGNGGSYVPTRIDFTTASTTGSQSTKASIMPDGEFLLKNNATMGAVNFAVDSGSTDTYAITIFPAPTAYKQGMVVTFKANTANTGAASLNVNSLGAITIVKGVSTTLANNDILASMYCHCVYDGTNFVLINPRTL